MDSPGSNGNGGILATLTAVKEGQERVERTVERELGKLESRLDYRTQALEARIDHGLAVRDEAIKEVSRTVAKVDSTLQNWIGRATVIFTLIILFFGGVLSIFWSAVQRGGN